MQRGSEQTELYAGVTEILSVLHDRGHRLAIATAKGRQALDRNLKQTGVGHFFETTRCADEVADKPDPKMLIEIMAMLDVEPEHTLYIGDTIHDMQFAKNAGIDRVGVCYGAYPREAFEKYNPLCCLDSIRELPLALEKGF